MRRVVMVAVILLSAPAQGLAQSIEGVWRMVEAEFFTGPNAGVYTDLQPAYNIYTDGHYDLTWVTGDGPRAVLGEGATAADLVAAWQPLVSQLGTYRVSGSRITYRQLVANVGRLGPRSLTRSSRGGTMSDADRIAARRKAFLADFAAEDIPRMTEFTTEDHVALPPNQPRRAGRKAAQEFWKEGFAAAKTDFDTSDHDVIVVGDLAIDTFHWQMRITPRGGGQALQDRGKCVWIWRKDSDGAWRVATAIWNSDLEQPGIWSGGGAWSASSAS